MRMRNMQRAQPWMTPTWIVHRKRGEKISLEGEPNGSSMCRALGTVEELKIGIREKLKLFKFMQIM